MAIHSSQQKHVQPTAPPFSAVTLILLQSIAHLKSHLPLFASIFLFLSLPRSLLFSHLNSSSRPVESQILQTLALSIRSSIPFEAWEMWKLARNHAVSLFHLKLRYFVPCGALSLATTVLTASSVSSSCSHRSFAVGSWLPPIATSICNYAILFAYSSIPKSIALMLGGGAAGVPLWGIGLGVGWYLTAVMNTAMVVSVVESRAGWDAIVAGSEAMEGRRICGTLLAVLMEGCGGLIWWRMERSFEEEKKAIWSRGSGWEEIKVKGKAGWWELPCFAVLYAALVVLGCVVSALFYFECRKKQVVGREDGVEVQNL